MQYSARCRATMGQYVSNFNRFSKVYKVMIQADPKYRVDEASLSNIFVRMANGEMSPLSQFVTLTRSYGAESLSRFNMYNSIAVNAMPAEGYSTGDAIRAVQETAEQALPKGYGYDFGGITREENTQSNTTIIIFGICFLMIYLILSALYESFLIPFAVLLAVPFGLTGSFLIGTLALLFVVPSLFIVFQYLQEKVRPIQFQPASDWQIQEEYVEAEEERERYMESKNEEKK